jgi:hypothetical protein
LMSFAQTLTCSTALSAEEYIQDSIKCEGRIA